MTSAFDIFGEIDLKTNAFEGSIGKVVGKLKATDAALDSTIAKSNKLGDTSATVARRYEKLSEGIKVQRQRLLDNALAFEKGEITSKKFASVVTSVDKATMSLSSRLKDAKARLVELDETGLTHFQQSISTAVDNATSKLELFRQKIVQVQQPQSTDLLKSLFGNLSGQQKTQLSFQLNDIITGLASGQSPMMILAQQGGQVFQVFQQGKKAQEGITTAINASTVAQAAFAAKSNEAAKAIAAAHASSTILGASVVSLGAVLAAGLVTIAAVYKITQDIEKAVQRRLKNEEDIVGALNKQALIKQQMRERLAAEQGERDFQSALQEANTATARNAIAELTRQRDAFQKQIDDELAKRVRFAEAAPGILNQKDDKGNPVFLKVETFAKGAADAVAKLNEQISTFAGRLDELNRAAPPSVAKQIQQNTYQSAIDAYQNSLRMQAEAAVKAEKEAADHRKKIIEESIKKAKEWAEHVKKAVVEVKGIFANTSDNPFVKIFSDGELAVNRMLEATKGLGSELQNTLKKLIDSQTQSKAFKQSMDNALKATGLRSEAGTFLGKEKPTISQSLQRQLEAIGGGSPFISQTFAQGKNGAFTELIKKADPNQRARDQKIIELTRGMNPEDLTPTQRQQAAAARIREAEALEKEKPDALATQKQLVEVLKKLQEGKSLTIDVNDPTNAAIVRNATPQTVNLRFPNQ